MGGFKEEPSQFGVWWRQTQADHWKSRTSTSSASPARGSTGLGQRLGWLWELTGQLLLLGFFLATCKLHFGKGDCFKYTKIQLRCVSSSSKSEGNPTWRVLVTCFVASSSSASPASSRRMPAKTSRSKTCLTSQPCDGHPAPPPTSPRSYQVFQHP